YQQFCYRYGWDLKSGIAQRYFHSSNSEEIYKDVVEHETSKFKSDYERLKVEREQFDYMVKQQQEQINSLIKEQRSQRDVLIAVLSQAKSISDIPDTVLLNCSKQLTYSISNKDIVPFADSSDNKKLVDINS
ncbi:hypothetical protein ACFL5S_02395, partial [Fibrobacterota bacterium]